MIEKFKQDNILKEILDISYEKKVNREKIEDLEVSYEAWEQICEFDKNYRISTPLGVSIDGCIIGNAPDSNSNVATRILGFDIQVK